MGHYCGVGLCWRRTKNCVLDEDTRLNPKPVGGPAGGNDEPTLQFEPPPPAEGATVAGFEWDQPALQAKTASVRSPDSEMSEDCISGMRNHVPLDA